ncbi:hypothetical protein BJY04DRAFT_193206 [Aspergillus karnatakaensis]|uniref:ankyrin repeat domain-containing protein n=1 Tax=Aspergillus karnatakaensis TaxID=1810916 RepID=UPI003CCCC85A
MLWHYLLTIALLGVTSVRAEGWDDFADNFAADLAPLVALFGERLTKQFLSESTSLLDNFIFALSPLGILTAVVSVIRICGNSSLRAFVGRANEAPGEAENELLSCVSEGTAELFNDGGISRVFGRPRLLEIVVWEENGLRRFGTLREALRENAWVVDGAEQVHHDEKGIYALSELDIPNLSLNKGIERRGRGWFYAAAFLGTLLQGGTVVYAGLTFFWYSRIFDRDGGSHNRYSFPVYLFGTMSLSLGMFLCAFLIERSSSETYLYPVKPSKIYWLQPGRQTIGEQDFGAFLAVNEGPNSQFTQDLTYVKSVRSRVSTGKRPLLLFTICVTMFGFVMQFVGLRGLHPSVIIADVGSTLLMAVVRTCLRTKRIGSDENKFQEKYRDLFSHNQQELDCFAFQLEKVQSFRLVSSPVHQTARSRAGSCSTSDSSIISAQPSGLGAKLIQTRARLAELTSCDRHPSMDWNDLPIRKVAHDLANTIEMTMEVVSRWKAVPSSTCSFELSFACQTSSHKSTGYSLETYSIELRRSEDTFQWRVDANELEAILGLWTFSLLKLDSNWRQNGLGRAVGLTRAEAGAEATDLYFHKWIFRQREARMVSSKMISFSEQTFGYYSDDHPDNNDILVVKTENNLEVMAAQDIYIQFLTSILGDLKSLGGSVDLLPIAQSSFLAQSTSIDELVSCFESGYLGSREDALLCIVPVLKRQNLLPELSADLPVVKTRVEKLIASSDWNSASATIRWLCERSEGTEFERSVYELGLLCQRAMLSRNTLTRDKGFKDAQHLLGHDIRSEFFKTLRSPRPSNWLNTHIQTNWWATFSSQLGWATWQIANRVDRQPVKESLESLGISRNLVSQTNGVTIDYLDQDTAQRLVLAFLDPDYEIELHGGSHDYEQSYMSLCLDWLNLNGQAAVKHWLLARWVEFGQQLPHQIMKAFVCAAKSKSLSAIQTLCRLGANIDAVGNEGCTALMEVVATGDIEATKKLLAYGADGNACTSVNAMFPLSFAAIQGREEILSLLLDHGANPELRNWAGHTPLHSACVENQLTSATLLLDRGADLESLAKSGRTPLMSSSSNAGSDVIDLLIRRGANVDATDSQGMTALMLAAAIGDEGNVRILLSAHADKQRRDILGRTALDIAREQEYPSIVTLLEAV